MKKILLLLLAFLLVGCGGPAFPLFEEQRREEETSVSTVQIAFPQFNDEAWQTVNEQIEDFVTASHEDFLIMVQDFSREALPVSNPVSGLYLTYERAGVPGETLSVVFTESVYMAGAAHPNSFIKTFTWDQKTKKLISLLDLFEGQAFWGRLQELAQEILDQQFPELDEFWQDEGLEAKAENFERFILTPEGIRFFFDPYQVAPYALGVVTVDITVEHLKDLVIPKLRRRYW